MIQANTRDSLWLGLAFTLVAILIVQFGAALGKSMFGIVSPFGVVFLRLGFSAITLLWIRRPHLPTSLEQRRMVLLFGLSLATMNLSFYFSLSRLPLGVAVATEFIGPLGVAMLGSKRPLDYAWVALAAIGILLFAPIGTGVHLDPLGLLAALLAGVCWGAYIVQGAVINRALPDGHGLAWSLCVAALIAAPFGLATNGFGLLQPKVLLAGFGVAMLSSAIPWSLEFEALKRLSTRIFGLLMSLELVVASGVGFVLLGEQLSIREYVAIVLILLANAGSVLRSESKSSVLEV